VASSTAAWASQKRLTSELFVPIPICPKCKREIASDDINVARDVAYCRPCNYSHQLSDLTSGSVIDDTVDVSTPPAGAWRRSDMVGTVIGASHRSIGTAIGALFIALFWNGIVSVFLVVVIASTLRHLGVHLPHWFPAPDMNGSPMSLGMTLFLWLFLTPFIAVGLLLLGTFLSSIAGRTEVKLDHKEGVVFSGVGPLGWRRRFDPETVKNVSVQDRSWRDSDGHRQNKIHIVLETRAGKEIKLGSMLSGPRRNFVAGALRQALKL
jgi:hypothetical protein